MNDFSELESQLKRLRPVPPGADLISRVERSLSESTSTATAGVISRVRRFQLKWSSLGLGLTAAIAFLVLIFLNVSRPEKKQSAPAVTSATRTAPATAEFVPAGLTRVVYRTRDEGLRFPSGAQQPMRRTRAITRETMIWRNPATGASIRVSYPSDEVSLTPVSGQ